MTVAAFDWEPGDGPRRLRDALARDGYARLRMGDVAREAAVAPWPYATRLLGDAPVMVERQTIRPTAGGRSFASTDAFTPLHTDSQRHLAEPPAVQVMVCVRPAARGGETTLLDAWTLLAATERDDPALFGALFHAPRRVPFVFGDVYGPTAALRGDALAFTHSPMPLPRDPVAVALAERIARCAPETFAVRAGEVLVVDNRRMLHGRLAFRDGAREFVRLLAWTREPAGRHPRYESIARDVARATDARLRDAPREVRARFGLPDVGLPDATTADGARRLAAVLEMLRGASPGVLAAREGVAEPELYRWRDAALRGALAGLDGAPADARDLDAALARLTST